MRALLQVSRALRDRKDQASGSTVIADFAKRCFKYLPKPNLLDLKLAESVPSASPRSYEFVFAIAVIY